MLCMKSCNCSIYSIYIIFARQRQLHGLLFSLYHFKFYLSNCCICIYIVFVEWIGVWIEGVAGGDQRETLKMRVFTHLQRYRMFQVLVDSFVLVVPYICAIDCPAIALDAVLRVGG